MAAVKQPRHLRRLPAETLGQLLVVEFRGVHRAIRFELGRGQRRQCDRRATGAPSTAPAPPRRAPFCPERFPPTGLRLERALQGAILSLRPAIRQVWKIDDVSALFRLIK